MSERHDHDDSHDLPHEGPIKTPKQLIWAVLAAFVVPVVAIVLLVEYVTSEPKPAAGSTGLGAEAVAARIQRVGRVVVRDLSDPAALKNGEQVYTAQCVACHGAGLAGAPKIGDAEAWAPRIKTGYEALLTASLKGKGAMGAQAGGDHSDYEIGRAVVYMANKSGAKFDEPTAPAGAASAPLAVAPVVPVVPVAPTAAAPAAVAPVAPAAPPAVTAAPAGAAAPALYTASCSVCHIPGVAGAPKLGDKDAWAPRLAQGIDGMTATVLAGKGAMPPRGGTTASDADIRAAVAYMVGTVN